MKIVEVHRDIIAKPDRVWAVLTNAPRLVAGGLGIVGIDGDMVEGGKFTLETASFPGRQVNVRITEFDRPGRMVWASGTPLLFTRTRTFILQAIPTGTAFHMAEVCRGLMLPLVGRGRQDQQQAFDRFADGLKRLAESV